MRSNPNVTRQPAQEYKDVLGAVPVQRAHIGRDLVGPARPANLLPYNWVSKCFSILWRFKSLSERVQRQKLQAFA